MSEDLAIATELCEVYATSSMSVSLQEDTDTFRIKLSKDQVDLKFCELTRFRNKIDRIDVVEMLSKPKMDIEVVYLIKPNRLFILTIHEILELRELFSGTFTMLSLNSLIHQQILRKSLLIA